MESLEYGNKDASGKAKQGLGEGKLGSSPANSSNSTNKKTTLAPCDYTIEKSLGKGVFGEVFLAVDSKGNRVALKRLPKSNPKFNPKLVQREIDVGNRLTPHDSIVGLKTFFETLSNVYLVFDYVNGSDLFTFMDRRDFNPLPENKTRKIFKQILDSLIHCHKNRVAHRDVKLDNILLDKNGKAKLIDFGLASMDEEGEHGCVNFVGSPEYVAPEIIKSVPYSGFKADVYSLGVSLYCMIYGQYPFFPEQRFDLLRNGKEHPPIEWPDNSGKFPYSVSNTLKQLLTLMLQVDPDQRITMEEVANHKWFTEERTTKGNVSPDLNALKSLREINVC